MNIDNIWQDFAEKEAFSGVFSVRRGREVLFEQCQGYRHLSEGLPIGSDTAFGIASGTKLFTGLAVCKLIDTGRLALDEKIGDILPYDLGQIDPAVTVFQLLTHTSCVGDYIDEDTPDGGIGQLAGLYEKYPVHLWERLSYYLPMITPLAPKFTAGERFGYSNSGYVLLGLIIEAVVGKYYQDYVTQYIIKPCGMSNTGFYRTDALPANTAMGYMQDDETQLWHSNIFCLPIVGGADGGLHTTAEDLVKLWDGIFTHKILSPKMTHSFLTPHVLMDVDNAYDAYGLGVYMRGLGKQPPRPGRPANLKNTLYYAVGGDFGVDFFTAYFPAENITASALGNTEVNTFPLLEALINEQKDKLPRRTK